MTAAPKSKLDLSALAVAIVDDSAMTRTLIRSILRGGGIQGVSEFGDGESAMAALGTAKPHLVLLDYEMETMNGVELTRAIRAALGPLGITPRVIMITGHGNAEIVRSAIGAGIDDFIVKPIAPRVLLEKIARFFKDGIPRYATDEPAAPEASEAEVDLPDEKKTAAQ